MIIVTGHTSGIGLAIKTWFDSHDYSTIGLSRATGHDLRDPSTIARIVAASTEGAVFINNAYAGMAQVNLLYALYDAWRDRQTTILSIGSNSSDGIKNYRHPYAVHKYALDKAVEQLQHTKPICRLMNLRLGYVDTPSVAHITQPKLTTNYVAGLVGWMIEQPERINTLTVVP